MCNQTLFTLYFSVWEILQEFYSPFHSLSLYPLHLSISFTSLSLPLSISISLSLSYLSLPLYISPSTFLSLSLFLPFFLSLSFSLFSLSFSLTYLMDVFVLVYYMSVEYDNLHKKIKEPYTKFLKLLS